MPIQTLSKDLAVVVVALGSGTQVQDVNKLLKQFDEMQRMMKKMRKGGMAKMMRGMQGLMGGGGLGGLGGLGGMFKTLIPSSNKVRSKINRFLTVFFIFLFSISYYLIKLLSFR